MEDKSKGLQQKAPVPLARGLGERLFDGDHIIVDGLTAGQEADLGIRAGGGKDGLCLLSLFLGHVLTVEDGHELGSADGTVPIYQPTFLWREECR